MKASSGLCLIMRHKCQRSCCNLKLILGVMDTGGCWRGY
jgi:hypothetical protein